MGVGRAGREGHGVMTYRDDKNNPLATKPTVEDIDAAIYGASTPPPSGRVVAKPVAIAEIWPDLTQPRRLVPSAAREGWDGSPGGIPRMIERWTQLARRHLRDGERLNPEPLLRDEDFLDLEMEGAHPVVAGLVGLIQLATDIKTNGLSHPVTVSRQADGYLLQWGERRLMAHWLLNMTVGEYDKIAAIEQDSNPLAQVAENTQRSDLNAIGMARALAKLTMLTREDEIDLVPYHEAESDRAFYAQALGLRSKRGTGEQVMQALNITNKAKVSKLRKLLTLPDELWTMADDLGWSESRCLLMLELPHPVMIRAAREDWSTTAIETEIKRQKALESGDKFLPRNLSPSESRFGGESGRFGGDGANASLTSDTDDHAPIRTSIGERMGLYDPHPPAPSPGGEEEKGGPVITSASTYDEWRASGYVYCPMPAEMEPGEMWTAEDEAIAAETHAIFDAAVGDAVELDRTPISAVTNVYDLLDKLVEMARLVDDRKGRQTAIRLRNRSEEDIRISLAENGGDLDKYKDKLAREGEVIRLMVDGVVEMVWDHIEVIYAKAQDVKGRM